MTIPLSSYQMRAVKTAAELLPTYQRDAFLSSVANRLAGVINWNVHPRGVADHDVHNAIAFVLSSYGVPDCLQGRAYRLFVPHAQK
jgi:hypothetical protein